MRQNTKNVSPMSNEGRNAYVVEHITDALIALLADKPIEDISISELCNRAMIGRASFYRNYANKEEILKKHIEKIFREECINDRRDGDPLHETIKTIFSHFERHQELYTLVNRRGLVWLLKDVILGLVGPKPEYPKELAYASAFVAYCIYGWIEVWFQRGMVESAEEMSEMFRERGL